MKKLFFLAFLALGTLTAQAQTADTAETTKKSCAKKCAKKCTKGAKASATDATINTEEYQVMMVSATAAAEANENIEKRVCAKSGKVSFAEKSVCPASGKVSYNEVQYCTKSNKFVNVSPSDVQATKVSMEEGTAKKACSAADKKKCAKTCASKAKKASTTAVEEMPKATKVSLQN